MESLGNFIKGRCQLMCPQKEIEMREREKLLHILEMVPGTEKNIKPKADPNRVVKSYCRSAAGKNVSDPNNLRPPGVLLTTVNYLLYEIVDADLPWHVIYDFVEDRLRAVRQDMVIQNASLAESISLMQPIVRFYAFFAYKLCSQDVKSFDPVLNKTQLQECLKKLLNLYDEYDQLLSGFIDSENFTHNEYLKTSRPEFEAMYLILNLGSSEPLLRFYTIPLDYRNALHILAFNISIAFYYKNYVKICRLIQKLPPLLTALVSIHLPNIRRNALEVMAVAYNNKILTFPLENLKNILFYDDKELLVSDCIYYGLNIENDSVHFMKNLISRKPTSPKCEAFVEKKIRTLSIQSLLLCVD